MDRPTVTAYDKSAADFAADWHSQPEPGDLHALVRGFFRPDGPTADIGCGSGREVAWLNANGYPATGFDPSEGLLAQARALYPALTFVSTALPDLAGVPDASFDNLLCETVLMHLPRDAIAPSVRRLVAILRPGGWLYLSWRVTAGADQRDAPGPAVCRVRARARHGRVGERRDPAQCGGHQRVIRQDHSPGDRSQGRNWWRGQSLMRRAKMSLFSGLPEYIP